ncbi:hypothetical protein V1520DRAFT_314929 [Lipomyces starkeyi]|uniref:Uncharacterized protein n=1 Tax=Lipomyces starkeyi NRRL Y-11557 TaxID=675824 RepID=A0A1E3PXW7_LIPST|nr:hypothetical protein LIPSTDRAFT_5763 [Lipomyces starkeyi NRRL Y-11557]
MQCSIHQKFDSFGFSINPDDGYKINCFDGDAFQIDGKTLDHVCRESSSEAGARDILLQWHFRQVVLANMRGSGEPTFEMRLPTWYGRRDAAPHNSEISFSSADNTGLRFRRLIESPKSSSLSSSSSSSSSSRKPPYLLSKLKGGIFKFFTLSNGSTLVADLYLPLFGVQVNSSFVSASLLDSAGNLVLDKTMRVVGTKNIWGIGDVRKLDAKQVTVTDTQIIHLSAALDSVLTGEGGQVKEYKKMRKTMIFITMGKKYATGQVGGWKLWGPMVSYVKRRMLFVDTAQGYVGGKQLRHAPM